MSLSKVIFPAFGIGLTEPISELKWSAIEPYGKLVNLNPRV
jgi:hypothetical protein